MISCNNVLAFTAPNSINYEETLETFNNPERGFYEPLGLNLKPTGNKALSYSSNLVHLRVNIGAFSQKKNGNADLELTDDALNALNTTLQYIKSKGGSVIIRFAYDFDGKANLEPSLDMILRHIEQLKGIFYKNRDVITYVELGFFGPWGEMHTSSISTTKNVSQAIDKMLLSVPESISIGVRTPNYYAAWAGIARNKLDTFKSIKGTKYYRVGLFNDGYLGSESDLGTFANRTKEIAWLNNQAKHTLYGGEVVANFASKPLNTVEYMSKEAFLTHTTYLNLRWNYTTIDNWKKEIYNGNDNLYVGQTGFKYIDNHLGYRFVLRNSKLNKTITNKDNLNVNFDIENVGFANLINNKKVTIVLENKDHIYEINTNINPTLWDSNSTITINENVKLPNNIALGNYNVYLRISYYGNLASDKNYKAIRLANDGLWNNEIGANYIGKINIIKYNPPKPGINTTKKLTVTSNKKTTSVVKNENITTSVSNEKPIETITTEQTTMTSTNTEESDIVINEDDNSKTSLRNEEIITEPKKGNNTLIYIISGLIGLIILSVIINKFIK